MKKNLLFFLFFLSSKLLAELNVEILVSAEEIKNQNQDQYIVEGKIETYINDDQFLDSLEYFYVSNAPPAACGLDENCAENNAQFMNTPTMTFDIVINDISGTRRIQGGHFCESIGIIRTSYTKGMPDLFCGPFHQLRWNGNGYVIITD